MVGVLSGVFIKLGGVYRDVYNDAKWQYQHHSKHQDKTKGHIHAMAIRKMIKAFLSDLWTVWRRLEGLPIRPSYAEEKLGIIHSKPSRIQKWLDEYDARTGTKTVFMRVTYPTELTGISNDIEEDYDYDDD